MRLLLSGLCLCALVAACDSHLPTTTCDGLYDAYVAYNEKCGDLYFGTPQINVLDTGVYDNLDVRAEFDDHYCNSLPQAPGASNLKSEIAACTAALSSAVTTCDQAAIAASCGLRGTLAEASPCIFNEQCASGFCLNGGRPDSTTSELGCGTCLRLVPLGGICGVDDTCDGDAYCSNGLCAGYAKEGEPCDSASNVLCEVGVLACDDFQTHTCVRLAKLGEPCTTICSNCVPECAWNLSCPNGTCVALSSSPLPQCGVYCAFGGTDAGAGMACSCPAGSVCGNQETDNCHSVKKLGEACVVGSGECGTSHFSLGQSAWVVCVNGTCVEPDYGACNGK